MHDKIDFNDVEIDFYDVKFEILTNKIKRVKELAQIKEDIGKLETLKNEYARRTQSYDFDRENGHAFEFQYHKKDSDISDIFGIYISLYAYNRYTTLNQPTSVTWLNDKTKQLANDLFLKYCNEHRDEIIAEIVKGLKEYVKEEKGDALIMIQDLAEYINQFDE